MRRLLRFRSFWLTALIGIAAACTVAATAQELENGANPDATTPPPPYPLLQYSTLSGSGNTLTAAWVPVVTSKGTTYKNVTIAFDVDSSFNLQVAPGYPQSVTATPPIVYNFKAGKYVGPSTLYSGEMVINVRGPGLAPGGTTVWTLSAATGAVPCTFPDNATWYVASVANSPLAARLKAAGITSSDWSYGLGGAECQTSYNNAAWYPNALIGISQVSNSLTIASFTDGSGKDHAQPVDTVTYALSQ
jgi:hypothetical protein